MDAKGRMMTVKEAAAYLQVRPITVQRWLRAGKMHGVRPGGTRMGWRVSEREVLRVVGEVQEGASLTVEGPDGDHSG